MAETLQDPNTPTQETNDRLDQELREMLVIGSHERAEQRAQAVQQPQPDDVEGFSRFWGIDDPELAQTIIEQAQERAPFVRVAHRIPRENLRQLIDTGGDLKSFFDTGKTQGGVHANAESYGQVRRSYEEKYKVRSSDDPEIIHGFLDDIDQLGEYDIATSYGAVELVFKSDVAKRSVFTSGDSLQNDEPPTDMMSAVRNRELQSRRKQTGEHNIYRSYSEALILDTVGLDDAEAIVFDDVNALNYDETLPLIDELHQQYPDLTFTMRIDANDTIYLKKLLTLVSEKPYISIVLAVEVQSPFLRSRAEPDSTATQNAYNDGTARLRELESKMVSRWDELGNTGKPLPERIKTAVVLPSPTK